MRSPIVQQLAGAGFLDRIFIGGEWVLPAGQARASVIDPSTEQPIADIALGNAQDVDRAVAAARRAFGAWSTTTPQARAALLDGVHALILQRAEIFAQAISLEMGSAITFARERQVPVAAEHIRVAREVVESYPFIQQRGDTAIVREPIGVCGLITPWNWPLYQVTAKVGPALAAGCTMVLKPSELSPLSAALFAQLMHDAGCPPGVFNLVHGDGPEVGAALSSHPDVDMISITGSTRAGVLVAQTAAPTVKRVAQELGGKSPNIVFADAPDLDKAAKTAAYGIFRNSGQVCVAGSRLLVERSIAEEFSQKVAGIAAAMKVGDPLLLTTEAGAISSEAQLRKDLGFAEQALAEGAKLRAGGKRILTETGGFYMEPTVFDVTPGMTLAREEVFGPILSIIPFGTEEEALTIANGTDYGLASAVWTSNLSRGHRMVRGIRAGIVHVNTYGGADNTVPLGGVRQSGNGHDKSLHALDKYLDLKTAWIQL